MVQCISGLRSKGELSPPTHCKVLLKVSMLCSQKTWARPSSASIASDCSGLFPCLWEEVRTPAACFRGLLDYQMRKGVWQDSAKCCTNAIAPRSHCDILWCHNGVAGQRALYAYELGRPNSPSVLMGHIWGPGLIHVPPRPLDREETVQLHRLPPTVSLEHHSGLEFKHAHKKCGHHGIAHLTMKQDIHFVFESTCCMTLTSHFPFLDL
jgi:hypothetical protein